ncbi:MAG: ATP-binding protein, partial [Xanthobacteraceae bacterium]
MPTAEQAVRDDEANVVFRGLENARGLILAVSGGPDSTALLVLAARWAKRLKRAPKLIAVTVDHGLRAAAAREAVAVKRLAKNLGVAHRTLHWRGRKPKSGLQEAARIARYRLLADIAARAGYVHILTAHT